MLFSDNFTAVSGDALTVVAGFVAIGIPLALQVAKQAADKYDSPYLARRLTSGVVVNPINIILLSFVFIVFSFLYKLLYDESGLSTVDLFNDIKPEISLFLLFIFFVLVGSAAWFIARLYMRLLTPNYCFISELLMLGQYERNSVSSRFLGFFGCGRKESYSKGDFARLEAGLEALIHQLDRRGWEDVYTEILFSINRKISSSYFSSEFGSLNKFDIRVVKTYWNFLLRVIRLSRSNYDARLSFHSQRLLSALLGRVVHSNSYEELSGDGFEIGKYENINWSTDVYELARWQSQQSSRGIDLYLECEWFSDTCNIMSSPDIRTSSKGTLDACRTLLSVMELVSRSHPEKLLKLCANVSEAIPSYYYRCDFFSNERGLRWVDEFLLDFSSRKFELYESDCVNKEVESLYDGKAYIKYGEFGISRPLAQEEIKSVILKMELEAKYKEAFSSYIKFVSLKFITYFAFFDRWEQLADCLEWRSPVGSSVEYIGEALFPSSWLGFERVISDKFDLVMNEHWFIDRHDFGFYFNRGLAFVLIYFFSRGENIEYLFSGSTVSNIKRNIKIIDSIESSISYFKGAEKFDRATLRSVSGILRKSRISLIDRKLNISRSSPVSKKAWCAAKSVLLGDWNKFFSGEIGNFGFSSIFHAEFSNTVQAVRSEVFRKDLDREMFVFDEVYSGSIGGFVGSAYSQFLSSLISDGFSRAVDGCIEDAEEFNEPVVFANHNKLIELGFSRIGNGKYEKLSGARQWYGIIFDSNRILVMDKSSVKVKLFRNKFQSEYPNALFLYLNDEHVETGKLTVCGVCFFKVEVSGKRPFLEVR